MLSGKVLSLTARDSRYPYLLRQIAQAPDSLFFMGTPPEADEAMVAIVGTRKASLVGLDLAKRFARELAEAGVTIVSGLALGIDRAAHEGALEGGGKTIAVLGNGLPHIYPAQHFSLAKQILLEGGCIFSEYPEGTPSFRNQFLERNRIVSGLSLGTLVIEAPAPSGSLCTAHHALEQNRELFVIPGPVTDRNYAGSHMLIREGAELVTSSKDILQTLGFSGRKKKRTHPSSSESLEQTSLVLKALSKAPRGLSIDKIIEITHLEPRVLSHELSLLVLSGDAEEKAGTFRLI